MLIEHLLCHITEHRISISLYTYPSSGFTDCGLFLFMLVFAYLFAFHLRGREEVTESPLCPNVHNGLAGTWELNSVFLYL